jgi:large subunit ribosomal protein L13
MGHESHVPVKNLLQGENPERVIEHAVFGMLPKNTLSRQKLRNKLKVYAGAEHPHAAQRPVAHSVTPKAK